MSFIYFIKNERCEVVKIGLSREPLKRLGQLQIGSVDPLQILGVLEGGEAEERALHERFSRYRRRGEWFDFTGELKTFAQELAAYEAPGRLPPPPLEIDAEAACHPDMVRRALLDGFSKAAIARTANVHANSLANMESDDWSPRWKTLQSLCAAVDALRLQRA